MLTECTKKGSNESQHISTASNLIRLHALASLTRIEADHVYITSKLIPSTCISQCTRFDGKHISLTSKLVHLHALVN